MTDIPTNWQDTARHFDRENAEMTYKVDGDTNRAEINLAEDDAVSFSEFWQFFRGSHEIINIIGEFTKGQPFPLESLKVQPTDEAAKICAQKIYDMAKKYEAFRFIISKAWLMALIPIGYYIGKTASNIKKEVAGKSLKNKDPRKEEKKVAKEEKTSIPFINPFFSKK